MSRDGYTLAEMLVALAIVGLTAGGLAEGARALDRIQRQTAAELTSVRAMATIQERFSEFLGPRGPFWSDDKPTRFQGSADDLSFPCGDGTCTAQLLSAETGVLLELGFEDGTSVNLPVPGVRTARFSYDDARTEYSDWPPSVQGLRLKSVTILGGSEPDQHPLAMAPLELEQAPDCEFDPIIKTCRKQANEPG
jgi:prepilin-type N-terminal cleavage/methylation domain-containing protein